MPVFQRPVRPNDPSALEVRTPEKVMRPRRDGNVWFVQANDGLSKKVLLSKGWTLCVGVAPAAPPPPRTSASVPEPEAQAPTEAQEEAPEPTVEAVDVEPELDLSVLDRSVKALRRALRTGRYDDDLDALISAEEGGKTRSSAIEALNDRVAEIA
jgi:hypothetical protein